MRYIAASLLSADMARLAQAVEMVAGEVDFIHCDVMDGHFVPNLTFGPPVVAAVKRCSPLPLDVHLMIESPGAWIEPFVAAGLESRDFLTFHLEAESKPEEFLRRIRSLGVRPGIAIKPATPVEGLKGLMGLVDQVLVMTVEPGFGGQRFQEEMLDKIRAVREMGGRSLVIGVDGGIDPDTAPLAADAGASLLVAGNAIYGGGDPVAAVRALKAALGM